MQPMSETLEFQQSVSAPPSAVFRAFTNATALREWLCDVATVAPHVGGRIYLAWNDDYYAAGSFTRLEEGVGLSFTWRGRDDPEASEVRVSLAPEGEGTLVSLTHSGLGEGEGWGDTRVEIERGWEVGLENLASVLESGRDLRILRRPMLGISFGDFSPDVAARLGVPVTTGVRLDDVVEGMGAAAAGLQPNDVLVRVGERPTPDGGSLIAVLQAHQAGDAVGVDFYRGGEARSVEMVLSSRPVPEIPDSAGGLAQAVRVQYDAAYGDLEAAFEGATEEQASRRPAPGEWSAKQVIAHLIHDERNTQTFIDDLLADQERTSDDFGGNFDAVVSSTVAAHPTLRDLLDAARCSGDETVALLDALPEEFVARKRSYWRLAFNLLQDPTHIYTHIEQIKAALSAAAS